MGTCFMTILFLVLSLSCITCGDSCSSDKVKERSREVYVETNLGQQNGGHHTSFNRCDRGHVQQFPPLSTLTIHSSAATIFSAVVLGIRSDSKADPAITDVDRSWKHVSLTSKINPVSPLYHRWLYALLSTTLMSLAPFLILFWIPVNGNEECSQKLLNVLLSFVSGGLLGDAFLHLIPHSQGGKRGQTGFSSTVCTQTDADAANPRNSQLNHTTLALWILSGFLFFLLIEKIVRYIKSGRKQSLADDNIRVSGYLNLAADFAHNFTDGLAIGASFLAGQGIGWITSLTILLHELPHELGDFALLIRSGCSKRKALALQLITTVGAFAGCLVSLFCGAGDTEEKNSPVMAFTAGGFIYIATVSIIPELLPNGQFVQSLKEIVALVGGIALMLVIALAE